jgi:UDP-N-acetylmuramate--alanine ligase
MNISEAQKIHFIGIGGIGISALAKLLKSRGKEITGSNDVASEITAGLASRGMKVAIGHKRRNVPTDADLVIYSAAIAQDNPELQSALNSGLPGFNYYQALGEIANEYEVVAIAGTHGKTTTTAMAGLVAIAAGLDPTVIVGGQVDLFDGNLRIGKSKLLITEADEYRRHFLQLNPRVVVLSNLEADHLDYYKDLVDIKSTFSEFLNKVPRDGTIIYNSDDQNLSAVVASAKASIVSYALNDNRADYRATGLLQDRPGTAFSLKVERHELPVAIAVTGLHNVYNSLSIFALAETWGIDRAAVTKVLGNFKGTWRRLQYVGDYKKIPVYDDYAHHPTEIKATLQALRQKHPDKRILAIFQPHLYSRTRALANGFVEALSRADEVVLADIYAAREQPDGTTSDDLLKKLKLKKPRARHLSDFGEIVNFVRSVVKKDDVVITMGAGDINQVAKMLVS